MPQARSRGFDAQMIIGVGFAFSEKFDHLAARHPDKNLSTTARSTMRGELIRRRPICGLTFKEEEGASFGRGDAALKSRTENRFTAEWTARSPQIPGRVEAGVPSSGHPD